MNDPKPDYAGMTVNERLFVSGLLGRWDDAVRARNATEMIALLVTVNLVDQAQSIVDSALVSNQDNQRSPPPNIALPPSIAPWPHTAAVLLLLLAGATFSHSRAIVNVATHPPLIPRYLTSIALEWGFLGIVLAGIRNRRDFLRVAFLNRARSFSQSLGFGLLVYCFGFLAIVFASVIVLATPLAHRRNDAVVLSMAPHSIAQFIVWFFVALTAGICEELVFRGYLQQQLDAWTRSPVVAIFLTAALFGSVHVYEGVASVIPLAALALVYGFVVRHFKGDLRAVIVAHALQDFLVAFMLLARPWLLSHQTKP